MLRVINKNRAIFEPDRDKVNAALILYKNLNNASMQDENIFNDDSEGMCHESVLVDCLQDSLTNSISFNTLPNLLIDDTLRVMIQSLNSQQRNVYDFIS